MTCEIEKRDGLVGIRGEMTIYEAPALKDDLFAALDSEPGDCAVELAGVAEFDTTGLQILMMAQRACAARGASFSLANPSAIVREALELLQIHSLPILSTGKSSV